MPGADCLARFAQHIRATSSCKTHARRAIELDEAGDRSGATRAREQAAKSMQRMMKLERRR